ncbi:MAG: outer membrane protein assembly factor BamA [Spirochaetaceae bacterium]|nr:outer membrane protein assembly factor BamA [Myxococcales bacterium]MCB9723489.1 outer membrane protein assembly factor BamA [Spirochaetaceae bacterium]
MRRASTSGLRAGLVLVGLLLSDAGTPVAFAQAGPEEYGAIDAAPAEAPVRADRRIVVLPFRVHSAGAASSVGASLDELLAQRIEAGGEVSAISRRTLEERYGIAPPDADRSDATLRALATQTGFDAMVAGSLTELAGRFSLDVRVTPADRGAASKSLVLTADSERELLDRVGELAERVVAAVRGGVPDRVVDVRFEGAGGIEAELEAQLGVKKGDVFDAAQLEADRRALAADPRIANVVARTQQGPSGVTVVFQIVRAERILGEVRGSGGETVAAVEVRGNRRVEADAIRARIRTAAGAPYDAGQVARDVRAVFQQGFFSDVKVFVDETAEGLRVVFDVVESPVVREIAVAGNDEIDGDKIKEALTLTTGTPLDYPLLRENVERVTALYRSEGFYLAEVGYEIEEIAEGSIAVTFDVVEKEKLKLRRIEFEGNEAFTDDELREGFSTKTWRFYSFATSWFDRTGTYSEPIFLRDLRLVEKRYTDNGYVQARVIGPEVEPREEGLFLRVGIEEGPQFKVGALSVEGDQTIDLEALRKKIQLVEGEVFSRSSLTADVETLETHYTDRGFFFANVNPITRTDPEALTVDVEFVVEKGPLYFVRNIDIHGNTRTVDSVIRREIRLVEGQLYSARALQVSSFRIKRLGYFEDVAFEPDTTEDPSQLDLDVNVVERPTGAFSFGAGFSSADNFIFTASLSQSNLFGRGYGANVSADIGGNSSRYFVSLTDPYFLGSTFSFSATAFLTQVRFNAFEQDQQGIEVSIGHPLTVDNTASISTHYSYSQRTVRQNTNLNSLAAPISRQVLQGGQSTSRLGLSLGVDTRNDRFAPTAGYAASGSLEYAGLGGFSRFLSFEARAGYYFGAPDWLFDRSTFVLSTRLGYALPFNRISEFDLGFRNSAVCADPANCTNAGNLDRIDDDVRLPLTERYFLGGLGNTRLRGYQGRSVGPRRAELRFTELGSGRVYHPVGTRLISNPATGQVAAICDDTLANRFGANPTFGNGNGRCNRIGDKRFEDFADIGETQVIGGSSFVSSSFEYRFPISEEIGLMGIGFIDGGNAFVEGDVLFDVTEWRYGYGAGVLWFSPFGPLQLVLGFPIDPRANEQSPVFEFSVGGLGI